MCVWGGAPCFRIGGAEDNFIFYIEYCFFFVPVMKLRWEYNISKQFQSISCLNVWLRAHVPPSKIFDTKKPDFTLFHDFSASQPSSFARNEQNITLQLRQNSSETDLVTRTHQNMPKIGCFGAFSHFFCFWCQFFENFKPKICFLVHQMCDKISQMTNICQKCTTRGQFRGRLLMVFARSFKVLGIRF